MGSTSEGSAWGWRTSTTVLPAAHAELGSSSLVERAGMVLPRLPCSAAVLGAGHALLVSTSRLQQLAVAWACPTHRHASHASRAQRGSTSAGIATTPGSRPTLRSALRAGLVQLDTTGRGALETRPTTMSAASSVPSVPGDSTLKICATELNFHLKSSSA